MLSVRLKNVFNQLNPRQNVWDFCCDHGYLGAAAYRSQNFGDIYFVDQVDTIMDRLKNRFHQFSFSEKNLSKPYFICQSGESIRQDVTGTVCMTGVGGMTIFQILDGLCLNNHLLASRLILGPHRDNEKLLQLISSHTQLCRYNLTENIAITESDRLRSLFVFDLQSDSKPSLKS